MIWERFHTSLKFRFELEANNQLNKLTHLLLALTEATDNESETLQLKPNQRFFLSSSNAIWIVESGDGDLFSLDKIEGKNEGPLGLLSPMESGSLLLGFPHTSTSEHISILFIASKPSRLRKLSPILFERLLTKHPEIAEELGAALTHWVNLFASLFSQTPIDSTKATIKTGNDTSLNPGEIYLSPTSLIPSQKHNILWIQISSGSALLLNQPNLKLASGELLYPLPSKSWLQFVESSSINVYTTKSSMSHPGLWRGLSLFQSHVEELIFQQIQSLKEKTEKQIIQREILEKDLLNKAFDQMASVLSSKDEILIVKGADPLFRAMQIIGNELSLQLVEPSEKGIKTDTRSRIAQICRSSQIRFRKVMLEGTWWKSDSGHLLGFHGENNTPVALIRKPSGKYEMIDPITKEIRQVDATVDEELSKVAYSLYQPFPEGELTGFSIIKFCLKNRWREIITIIATGAFGALLSLFIPFANQLLFNHVIKGGEQVLFSEIIVGLIIIAFSTTCFLITRSYATLRLGQLIDSKLESALWDRILSLPATFFRKFTAGNLIQRIYAVSQMHQLLTGNALKVILSGIFSIFYFIAMLNYSGRLAFFGFIVVFISLIISATCISIKTHLQRKILEVNGNLNGILVQLILGVGKLRVAGAENRAFAYWSDHFSESKKLQLKAQTIQNIVTVTTSVLPILSSAVLFTGVIQMLSTSENLGSPSPITIGAVIAFMAAYVPFSQAIFDAINTVINLVTVVPLWERAKVILQETPESTKEKEKLDNFIGEVSIDHIFFKYEKDGPYILQNVSIHAAPGEFVAIVGPSGSGKSTLVRLLLGFETPENGTIYYDQKDINTLDVTELRRKIGTVLQNGAIFSGSIHENIACGGAYTHNQIEKALEVSGFGEDLKNLPMGLHTILQSGGGTFSGGQAQRLLIARALITNPKVLIFDEATSALDTKTQDLISHNLDLINVTRIVIAHRLSTIKNADRIYVMDKGSIVDSGTFSELAEREGLFKQMLIRQTL